MSRFRAQVQPSFFALQQPFLRMYNICCVGWVDTPMTLKIRTCAHNGNIANKTSPKTSTLCRSLMRRAKCSGTSQATPSITTITIIQLQFRLSAPDHLSSTSSMATRDITTTRAPHHSLVPLSFSPP